MQLPSKILAFATAFICVLGTSSAAFAVSATAKSAVNVRSGPGTSYNIVDSLYQNEAVNVTECQGGWCYVEHEGPNGWVSGNYLNQNQNQGQDNPTSDNSGPNANFGITITPDGPSISFSIGNGPRPAQNQPKVCFFDGPNYTGTTACVNAGTSDNKLTGYWNDRISSLRVADGASVTLCRNWYFGGYCRTYDENTPFIGSLLNDRASSYSTED